MSRATLHRELPPNATNSPSAEGILKYTASGRGTVVSKGIHANLELDHRLKCLEPTPPANVVLPNAMLERESTLVSFNKG